METMTVDEAQRVSKDLETITGLRIVNNPYTLGCDVVDRNNKVHLSGDPIKCAAFILKFYDFMIKELIK